MTTVKEFKDLGVDVAHGDKCFIRGQEYMFHSNDFDESFGGAELTFFAWRPLNTLPDSPKFKYEQDLTNAEIKWRPLLEQSQAETKEEKEALSRMKPYEFDAHVSSEKPVFTQAMADAKELPYTGSVVDIKYKKGNEFNNVIVCYSSEDTLVYRLDIAGRERFGAMECIEYINPSDTRTPKQKAVDAMVEIIDKESSYRKACDVIYDMIVGEKC